MRFTFASASFCAASIVDMLVAVLTALLDPAWPKDAAEEGVSSDIARKWYRIHPPEEADLILQQTLMMHHGAVQLQSFPGSTSNFLYEE